MSFKAQLTLVNSGILYRILLMRSHVTQQAHLSATQSSSNANLRDLRNREFSGGKRSLACCSKISEYFCRCIIKKKAAKRTTIIPMKKVLALDLDETLVHSSFQPRANADLVVKVTLNSVELEAYVSIRPHFFHFLTEMSKIFEVAVFTAGVPGYASAILDEIDTQQLINYRFYRESCLCMNGSYIKDLRVIGRDLDDVLIIDNSPISYHLQPFNAVPITSWFDNIKDRELLRLIPILSCLSKVRSIPETLRKLNEDQVPLSRKNILDRELPSEIGSELDSPLSVDHVQIRQRGNK